MISIAAALLSGLLFVFAGYFLLGARQKTVLSNVPGPEGGSWLLGHFGLLTDGVKGWSFHQSLASTYGPITRIKSMFGKDALYVYEPSVLNLILIKESNIYAVPAPWAESAHHHFADRLLVGDGIFASVGERHRIQRKMMFPVFSMAHMRHQHEIFNEVTLKLKNTFMKMTKKGPITVDVLDWNGRLALELIGQAGLGWSFDSLEENTAKSPYTWAAKQLFMAGISATPLRSVFVPRRLLRLIPAAVGRWLAANIPSPTINTLYKLSTIMHKTAVEVFETKKRALAEGDAAVSDQVAGGKDLLSILLQANLKADGEERLSDEELIGQVNSFTFAATDTTSTALCRIYSMLSENKDAQDRLRQELRRARKEKGGQDLDYDELNELPFLDAVCRETLRLFPPVSQRFRRISQDTVLPLATPIKGIDGIDISEIPLKKGTDIFVSIMNSNRNPELWGPDACEWKPERWLDPLPATLVNAKIPGVYSHLLTFLGGGRSCMGFKFSQLEMKVVLAHMVDAFEFSPSGKEVFWQMAVISTPCAAGTKSPSLPMQISRAP